MVGAAYLQLSTALADGNNWMSTVDGNTYVSKMSIPGAHDAATGHGFTGNLSSYGSSFATTQSLTITELWNAGVRAFDLRPALKSGNNNSNADVYSDLYVWHGIIQTKITMQSALETLCTLLDNNPTETAIIICRHETDAYYDYTIYSNTVSDNATKFKNKMTSMFTKNTTIKNHLLTTFRPDLKLDDVRGKIIFLMRDVDLPNTGKVTNWNQERAQFLGSDNARIDEKYRLFIVDYWATCGDDNNPDATKVAHKSDDIRRTLQYTTQEHMNDGVWVMNEVSGYDKQTSLLGYSFPASSGYASNAVTQAPVAINYLNSSTQGSSGIMWMDYAGVNSVKISGTTYNVRGLDLCNAVIAQNSKPAYTSSDYEEYHRALNSIPNGAQRLISTTINGTKYYLKADGYLSSSLADAGAFTFTYATGNYNGGWTGWSTPCYGMFLNNGNNQYFTNGPGYEGTAPNQTVKNNDHFNLSSSQRGGWETQGFYQNSDGKYAIRACHVDEGTNWNVYGKAYWDVNGTTAQYSFNRNYIWELEIVPTLVNVTYKIFKDNQLIDTVVREQFTGSRAQLPARYSTSTYGLTLSYDIDTIDESHTTVNVTANWTDELPFTISTSYNNAVWYYMCGNANANYTNNWYLHTDGDAIGWGAKGTTDAYKWAFMGNPVTGIKIINKATGATKYLTNTDPGSMTTTQYGWPIIMQANYHGVTNGPGFCFREVDRGQYLNVYAGQAQLHYWNGSDEGSTFWVEGAQDITYNVIYNNQVVRTGVGHQSAGEPAELPAELEVGFATYTYDVQTIASNTTTVNATIQSIDLPFKPSTDFDNAHWYYMRNRPTGWRDSYNYTNGDYASCTFVHQADPAYLWAFIGDPINGFKVVNKATGADKHLKNDSYFTMDSSSPATATTVYVKEQKTSTWQVEGTKSFGLYYPDVSANMLCWADVETSGRLRAGSAFNDGTTFWVEDPMEIDIAPYFVDYGQPFQLKRSAYNDNLAAFQAAHVDNYTYAQYANMLAIVKDNDNRVMPTAEKPLKVRIKSDYFGNYMNVNDTTLTHTATADNASVITIEEGTGENAGKYSMKIGNLYVQQVANPCTLGENPFYFSITMHMPTQAIIGNDGTPGQFHQTRFMNANSNGNVVCWKSYDLASYWTMELAKIAGDVTGEGNLTAEDLRALVDILLGKDNGATPQYDHEAADVNEDSRITLGDVTTLSNILNE